MKCTNCSGMQAGTGKLDMILRNAPLIGEFAFEHGFTMLLTGPPGAGKTTLALYLLHSIRHELRASRKRGEKLSKALLLSLVETPEQIEEICDLYDLDFGTIPSRVQLVPARFCEGEVPDLKAIAKQARMRLAPGDLLFVDGLGVLGTQYREGILSFLDQIKREHLVAILVTEEYREHQDHFLRYAVDCVINLEPDPVTTAHYLEIAKFRWHDHYLGKHAFRLKDKRTSAGSPPVLFFPSAQCLTEEQILHLQSHGPRHRNAFSEAAEKGMSSGVRGFDQIAGVVDSATNLRVLPFKPGEQSLLIGPAGSGLFLFGTQFLAAAGPEERSICVSFMRDFPQLRERLLKLESQNNECFCLDFSPTGLVLEEMLGAVWNALRKHEASVTRLFIDGISALRCLFESDRKFEWFLLSFLRLISSFPNVTALLSYYTPRVFESYADLYIPVSEQVSMVIGFNFQEQYNQLVRGIVILKSRSDSLKDASTALKVPKVTSEGIYELDLQAGWSRVGLLSGPREQVHEEKPFVKLFFENTSEEQVVRKHFEDFSKRYPGDSVFRMVAKKNPQPWHWSFRGYAGPGHSNIKLVELRKYVMDVLRDSGVLLEVPREISARVEDRFRTDFLWNDFSTSARVMIPFYADVGVLVYQEPALRELQHTADGEEVLVPETWDDIVRMARRFRPKAGIRHLFIIPNTVNDSKNFVSFFFELCWTFGWSFPDPKTHLSKQQNASKTLAVLEEWVEGEYFKKAASLLRRMVSNAIPNPNTGGHYHESVFARRWFSKIHLLPEDARGVAGRKALRMGIAPLPGIRDSGTVLAGVSNVDLYSLGIVRQALAPETGWMLASQLLEFSVDADRAKFKRGLPISRKVFRMGLIQDSLAVPPPPPETAPDLYQGQEHLFSKYPEVLKSILDPPFSKARFRRTADIMKFFELEELLARELPKLFEGPVIPMRDIIKSIRRNLKPIYA